MMHSDLLTQLLAAVRHDNVDRVIELLDRDAPANGQAEGSELTALHVAVEHSSHAALRVLLARGARPDQEAHGLTPLGLAVDVMIDQVCQDGGDPDQTAIDLLLGAGASPRAGSTSAVDVAKRYGAPPELLRRLGALGEDDA